MNTQAMQDKDTLAQLKRKYYSGEATESEVRAAAVKVLENTRAAEKKIFGRYKTQITEHAILKLIG